MEQQSLLASGAAGRDCALGLVGAWESAALLADAGVLRRDTFVAAYVKTAASHAALESQRIALAHDLARRNLAGPAAACMSIFGDPVAAADAWTAALGAGDAAATLLFCALLLEAAAATAPAANEGAVHGQQDDRRAAAASPCQAGEAALAGELVGAMEQRAAAHEARQQQLVAGVAAALGPTHPAPAAAWLLGTCRQLLGITAPPGRPAWGEPGWLSSGRPQSQQGMAAPTPVARGWRWWQATLPSLQSVVGLAPLLQLLPAALPGTAGCLARRHAATGLLTALLQEPGAAPGAVGALADALRAAAVACDATGAAAVLLLAQLALDSDSYSALLQGGGLWAAPASAASHQLPGGVAGAAAAAAAEGQRSRGFAGECLALASSASTPAGLLRLHSDCLSQTWRVLPPGPPREAAQRQVEGWAAQVQAAGQQQAAARDSAAAAHADGDVEAGRVMARWLTAFELGGGMALPLLVLEDMRRRQNTLKEKPRPWHDKHTIAQALLVPPRERMQAVRQHALAQALAREGMLAPERVAAFAAACCALGVDPLAPAPPPALKPSALAEACQAVALEQLLLRLAAAAAATASEGSACGGALALLLGRIERELSRLAAATTHGHTAGLQQQQQQPRQALQPCSPNRGADWQRGAQPAAKLLLGGGAAVGSVGSEQAPRQLQLLAELVLQAFCDACAAGASGDAAPAAQGEAGTKGMRHGGGGGGWQLRFVAMLQRLPALHEALLGRLAALAVCHAGDLQLQQAQGLGCLLSCMSACCRADEPVLAAGGGASSGGQGACRACFGWACSAEALHSAAGAHACAPPAASPSTAQQQQQRLAGWEVADLLLARAALGSPQQLCASACLWASFLGHAVAAPSWCQGSSTAGLATTRASSSEQQQQQWGAERLAAFVPDRLPSLMGWLARRLAQTPPLAGAAAPSPGTVPGPGAQRPGSQEGLAARMRSCQQLCAGLVASPLSCLLAGGEAGGAEAGAGGTPRLGLAPGSQWQQPGGTLPSSQQGAVAQALAGWEATALRQGLALPAGLEADVAALVARRLLSA